MRQVRNGARRWWTGKVVMRTAAAEPQKRLAGARVRLLAGAPRAELGAWSAQASSGPRRAPWEPPVTSTPVTAVRLSALGRLLLPGQLHSHSLQSPGSTCPLSPGAPTLRSWLDCGVCFPPSPINLPSRSPSEKGPKRSEKREERMKTCPGGTFQAGHGHGWLKGCKSAQADEAQGGLVLLPSWVCISLSLPHPP